MRYRPKQPLLSGGFDFKPPTPGSRVCGPVPMLDLSVDKNMKLCKDYAGIAIRAFNHKFEGRKKELKLVKVVLASYRVASGFIYYLTFVASKPGKKRRTRKTYQALVTDKAWDYEVIAFRREAAGGSNPCKLKWYWDNEAGKSLIATTPSEC